MRALILSLVAALVVAIAPQQSQACGVAGAVQVIASPFAFAAPLSIVQSVGVVQSAAIVQVQSAAVVAVPSVAVVSSQAFVVRSRASLIGFGIGARRGILGVRGLGLRRGLGRGLLGSRLRLGRR